MSKSIPVTDGTNVIYTIELKKDFGDLCKELTRLKISPDQKLCIVTDSNVAPLYAKEVQDQLSAVFSNVFLHIFPAGEASKNTDTVGALYQFLIENHFDRRDILLALGGGVVGDLTGFTAATYLRGIDFIQIPTTLLSQVDSSIGGKTGIDFMQYKNMVGAFYQPKLVYMNLSVLHSLPGKQIVSGMGEIIKHGLIKDASYFEWLIAHEKEIWALDPEILEEMIYISCNIKRDVVERDPKEQGERALLNLGHTIGHAVEKLMNFNLLHGQCVGIGLVAAAAISRERGLLTNGEYEQICHSLKLYDLPLYVEGLSPQDILAATKKDKKMEQGQIKFILMDGLGKSFIDKTVTDQELLVGIHAICR